MPHQPRTAKEAAPAVLRVAPTEKPTPRARAGTDYSKVGRAIWMLQVSTGRWDPSTPIPFSRSSPQPSGSEPDASELEIPDEADASADVRNPLDEFTAPHISPQGEISFPSRPGSAEQAIPESPNDRMQNLRFPNLASPDQLPSTPLTEALRILGRAAGNGRTDDSPALHSMPDGILDSRAIQSAISATPFGPASPGADPGLDRFFKPSPLGPSDFAGREMANGSFQDLVMRVPPGIDPAGPMPNWLTGAMPIPNFNPKTDPIRAVQIAQHDEPAPPAGNTRSTMPLDSRTAQEQELRFDAYFRAKKAALPSSVSPTAESLIADSPNSWVAPSRDSVPGTPYPTSLFDTASNEPRAVYGAPSPDSADSANVANSTSIQTPVEVVVRLRTVEDEIRQTMRTIPEQVDKLVAERIESEIRGASVRYASQRSRTFG